MADDGYGCDGYEHPGNAQDDDDKNVANGGVDGDDDDGSDVAHRLSVVRTRIFAGRDIGHLHGLPLPLVLPPCSLRLRIHPGPPTSHEGQGS